jgi:hypothetical protein
VPPTLAGFQHLHREAEAVPQTEKLVKAGKSGADDQCVKSGWPKALA